MTTNGAHKFRLSQRLLPPAVPQPVAGGLAPGQPDPVSSDLFRRIGSAVDDANRLWAECHNANAEFERVLAERVGLSPRLLRDPRNLADPEMQEAYYRAFEACDRYETVLSELADLRAQFAARVRWRLQFMRALRTPTRVRVLERVPTPPAATTVPSQPAFQPQSRLPVIPGIPTAPAPVAFPYLSGRRNR